MRERGVTAIFIILGLVFMISIAGGAYYLGISKNKPQVQNSPVASQTPQPALIPQITSASDEISNWKMYSNKNLQYQISYPENTQNQVTEYEQNSAQPSLLGSTNIDLVLGKNNVVSSVWISVWKNLGVKVTDITSRDEWCKKLQPELQGQQECFYQSGMNIEESKLNNYKAFKVTGGRGNSLETRYYIPYKDYIYEISISRPIQELDNSLPSKVLSTFKFTN